MDQTSSFDACFAHTSRRALFVALALTADVDAARTATVAAYAAAWSQWRTPPLREAPDAWVREQVLAGRRAEAADPAEAAEASEASAASASAKVAAVGAWSPPGPDPQPDVEQAALLDVLRGLPDAQRRAWTVVEIAGLDLDQAATALDRPVAQVRDDLEAARTTLGRPDLDDATPDNPWSTEDITVALEELVEEVPMPSAAQVRAVHGPPARRRRHGVRAAVAAAVLTVVGVDLALLSGAVLDGASGSAEEYAGVVGVGSELSSSVLLDASQLDGLGRGGWEVTSTSDEPSDTGPSSLCQRGAADPSALGLQNRRFRSESAAAEETVVRSSGARQAVAAYDRALGSWSSCTGVTVLLEDSYGVEGVGEDSHVLTVRDWADPSASYVVAIARAGSTLVSLVSVDPVAAATAPDEQLPGTPLEAATTLAAALSAACAQQSTDCGSAGTPDEVTAASISRVPPPAPAEATGLLETADLPPAGSVQEAWLVGSPVDAAGVAGTATTCDRLDLERAGAAGISSRTFDVPGDIDLPDYFGLAQTAGTFASEDEAARVLDDVVGTVDTCAERSPAAEVRRLSRDLSDDRAEESAAWTLAYDDRAGDRVVVRTAIVRNGSSVAQVTFTPGPDSDMTSQQFGVVVTRARVRLADLG